MFIHAISKRRAAILAILLAPAAVAGVWALSGGPSVAGESSAPVALSLSGLFGEGAFLGVQLEEETEYEEGGARITGVVTDSAADRAGLEKGDILVAFDGKTIRGPGALSKRMSDREPGDSVSITVVRDGREQSFDVELGEREGLHGLTSGRALSFFTPGAECDDDDEDCENYSFDLRSFMRRPLLGVQLVHVTDELREHMGSKPGRGVLVSKVVADSAAEDAGIDVDDLIVAVDGRPVEDADDIRRALDGMEGRTFDVEVLRDGRPTSITVTIPERDEDSPTGPRAFHFKSRIELDGMDEQIQEAIRLAQEAVDRMSTVRWQVDGDVHREALDAYRDALGTKRDAMRQSREAYRDALHQSRESADLL